MTHVQSIAENQPILFKIILAATPLEASRELDVERLKGWVWKIAPRPFTWGGGYFFSRSYWECGCTLQQKSYKASQAL